MSFVIAATFVILNLFIAAVLNSLEEAKHGGQQEIAASPTDAEVVTELQRTKEALERLQERLWRA